MTLGAAMRAGGWIWCITSLAACLLCLAAPGGRLYAQTEAPSENAIISLSVAPNDPARVVVGTLNTPGPAGVFHSEDGGVSWNQATGLPEGLSFAALEHDAVNPTIVYVGDAVSGLVYRSQNGGRHFEALTNFLTWLSQDSGVGVLYSQENGGFAILHAGTRRDGVLTSYDNGESWVINGIGLPFNDEISQSARRVRAIAEFSGDLYIGTHNGIYAQPRGTDAWVRVEFFEEGTLIRSLGAYRGMLYAGLVGDGLWRSADGVAWSRAPGYPVEASVFSLNPSDTLLLSATGLGLWAGNGDNWLKAAVNEANFSSQVWVLEGTEGVLYAGTASDWILRSDDQGYSFHSSNLRPALTARALAPIIMPAAPVPPVFPTATPQTPASEPAAAAPSTADPTPTATVAVTESTGAAAEPQPTPTAASPAPTPVPTTLLSSIIPESVQTTLGETLGDFQLRVVALVIVLVVLILVGVVSIFRRSESDE